MQYAAILSRFKSSLFALVFTSLYLQNKQRGKCYMLY